MQSKYESVFLAAVVERERQVCISVLRDNPEVSLGELHNLSKGSLGRILDSLSLAELISGETSRSRPSPARQRERAVPRVVAEPAAAANSAPTQSAVAATPPGAVDTRSPAARSAYDEALFAAVAEFGRPVGIAKLMKRAGGTNLQARAAVNRLIKAGRVLGTGKARGTRYSPS